MLRRTINKIVRPLAMSLQKNHIRKLGIADTMPIVKVYNRPKLLRYNEYRKAQYRDAFDPDRTRFDRLGVCCNER
jgi:hypothetical protein